VLAGIPLWFGGSFPVFSFAESFEELLDPSRRPNACFIFYTIYFFLELVVPSFVFPLVSSPGFLFPFSFS